MAERYGTTSRDRWTSEPERGFWDFRWIVQFFGFVAYFFGR